MVGRPFEQGEHRTGRAKGTPNKVTQTIKELIELEEDGTPGPIALWRAGKSAVEKGYTAQKIIRVDGEDVPVHQTDAALVSAGLGAMSNALKFAYPTMKAVEMTGELRVTPMLEIVMQSDKAPVDAS